MKELFKMKLSPMICLFIKGVLFKRLALGFVIFVAVYFFISLPQSAYAYSNSINLFPDAGLELSYSIKGVNLEESYYDEEDFRDRPDRTSWTIRRNYGKELFEPTGNFYSNTITITASATLNEPARSNDFRDYNGVGIEIYYSSVSEGQHQSIVERASLESYSKADVELTVELPEDTYLVWFIIATAYEYLDDDEWHVSYGALEVSSGHLEPYQEETNIELVGMIRSVEDEPMRWMEIESYLYYGKEEYPRGSADMVLKGITDHKGLFDFNIPIKGSLDEPIGVLLTATFKSFYPFTEEEAFKFIDHQDDFSRSRDRISISAWFTIVPKDYINPRNEEEFLPIYRVLLFQLLQDGFWSFSETLEPDQVITFLEGEDKVTLYQNYSYLYTKAQDAWFFGGVLLDEKERLLKNPATVNLRWEGRLSKFDPRDYSIYLTDNDSGMDDGSRFTILHEFGHYFDYATNETGYRGDADFDYDLDEFHGGYMNSSTSDSYIEGFATFYAGWVQKFSGYDSPETIVADWIILGSPNTYQAWGYYGLDEELAIANFLYQTSFFFADVRDYWDVLKIDRNNFYQYYLALEAAVEEKGESSLEKLESYAIAAGLYEMKFGNDVFDYGEPFRDEEFADLMYELTEDGRVDRSKPLKDYDKENLVLGKVSDALRDRYTILRHPNSFIHLDGVEVDAVLIKVLAEDGLSFSTVNTVVDQKVYFGAPATLIDGTVEIWVPGGEKIYEGDLRTLQDRRLETFGQNVALDNATVREGNLAEPGTLAVSTYGNLNNDGVLKTNDVNIDELISIVDNRPGNITLDEVVADHYSRLSTQREMAMGEIGSPTSLGFFLGVGIIVLVLGVGVGVVIKRKRKSNPPLKGQFYLWRDGQQYGPYSWNQIIEFAKTGYLGTDDMICGDAIGNWQPAAQLPQLARYFH